VTGNFFPDEESQTGLWVSVPEGASREREDLLAGLDGSVMASVSGPGTVISYPIAEALAEVGLTFADLQVQTMPFADIVTALQNDAVYSGWVVDPLWRQLQDDADLEFLVGQPAGEPLGGFLFGPALSEDREAAVAFLRAYIRTVNTHFSGDYKDDPEFLTELATLLGTPEDVLGATPSLDWDWEIRSGTIDRMQEAYLAEGALAGGAALPESQLVDRSYYEEVVGAGG
jgi:NitT/TauT family transport system substrate-binding protein